MRGFAALYVVVYHLALIPSPNLPIPQWLHLYVSSGGTGVSLFFVLSAFALSYSLDARQGEPNLIRDFYIRRFFRIAPLFYVLLGLSFLRDWLAFDTVHSATDVLINASMLFNLSFAHTSGYVWASWTIGVEVLFYLIFPLVHRHVHTLKDAITLFLALILLSQAWSWLISTYGSSLLGLSADQQRIQLAHSVFRQLPLFMLGVISYRVYKGHLYALGGYQKKAVGRLLLVAFLFVYTALQAGYLKHVLWGGLVWQGVAYCLLTLGLALYPWRGLVNFFTVRLGKMSYSLYLNHPSLIFWLAPVYYWLYSLNELTTFGFIASFAVTLAILSPISWVSYSYIERWGIRQGERIISHQSIAR